MENRFIAGMPTPADIQLCDTPEQAATYWKMHIEQHPYFNPERECLVVSILNTRRTARRFAPPS